MKTKSLLSLLLLLMAIVKVSWAQQLPAEQIKFSIPKSLFFTDEKIWIRASIHVKGSSAESQVIYAELLDDKNKSWAMGKLPVEMGNTLNYLQLESTIPSGNYLLRVFSRISANDPTGKGISQAVVTVLNPSIPPQTTSEGRPVFGAKNRTNSLLKTVYQTEEKINLSAPEEGISSIQVSVKNPYLEGVSLSLESDEIYQSIETEVLLPELFGHIVHAKLNEEKIDTTRTYFLSAHGSKSALFTDRPDLEGNLYFDLGGFRHWDHLLIQVEDGSEIPDLELINPGPKTTFKSTFDLPDLIIHRDDAKYLQELKTASALEPYYNQEYRFDSIPVVTGFVADQSYLLDNYTRFETVETVIKEYVPGVAMRRVDKQKEFRLLNNPANSMFDQNPLIMVDAMPVFISDMLANFNPKFFQKLEVLNREFYLNDRAYSGVLSFSSYENNFGLFQVPDQVLYLNYSGVNPFISFPGEFAQQSGDNRTPDYRSILFWQESFSGNEISFHTSKMKGVYEMIIHLKDPNSDPIKEEFVVN